MDGQLPRAVDVVPLAGLLLLSECKKDAFQYDPAEVTNAEPWTSEDFMNNPDHFHFAVLGDRGSGTSPLGTYERAFEQLNLIQRGFVMSVGDYISGCA